METDGAELTRLRHDLPLGPGWAPLEHVEDSIEVAGARIARAGLASHDERGREASGSAAEIDGAPIGRAYFELVERVSILEAMAHARRSWSVLDASGNCVGLQVTEELFPDSDDPARWQYARSNGIALHASYDEARRRAVWELIERDRVLRSWHGLLVPERHDVPAVLATGNLASVYDWRVCILPDPEPDGWAAEIRVAVVVGFPRSGRAPLVRGSAARPRAAQAVEAAAREALQQLAFLWDEEIPSDTPELQASPQLHLDWYLFPDNHAPLRGWLGGGHRRFRSGWTGGRSPAALPSFVDMTPRWLEGKAFVVKALCPDTVPLTFGDGPPELSAHLPAELRVHPVA